MNENIMKTQKIKVQIKGFKSNILVIITSILLVFSSLTVSAHCDSYDGPCY